jgi:integrase
MPAPRPRHDVARRTRTIKAIDRSTPLGLRDYALLMMMAGYGVGAAEAVSTRLDDLDWRNQTLHIVRPKTKVEILLPLTGPVGRAISAYLRYGRPRVAAAREIFLKTKAPYSPIGPGNVRRIFHRRACQAGVVAVDLGAHVLRHSHATKQVEIATPPKVVSDILGHRSTESLSTYARVARERLRSVSLPPPRR